MDPAHVAGLRVVHPEVAARAGPRDVVELPGAVLDGVVRRPVVVLVLRRVRAVRLEPEPEVYGHSRIRRQVERDVTVRRAVPVLGHARLPCEARVVRGVERRPRTTAIVGDVDVAVVVVVLHREPLVPVQGQRIPAGRVGRDLREAPLQNLKPVIRIATRLAPAIVVRAAPPRAVAEIGKPADPDGVVVPVVLLAQRSTPVKRRPAGVVASLVLEIRVEDPEGLQPGPSELF